MTPADDFTEDSPARKKIAQRRSRVIGVATALLLTACAVQLFVIQIVRGPALAEQGRSVRTSASELHAPRGTIVDAEGQVLVDSVQTYHIAVNQKAILEYQHYDEDANLVGEGPAEAAKQLAPLLEMNAAELGGLMLGDSTYNYLAKNVDAAIFREIRKLRIQGIEWEPVYERVYPAGNTAATVLGSVNAEGGGDSGLELTYDTLLTGVPGEESSEIGPTGAVIPGARVVSREALQGGKVHTSLHMDLQSTVQNELDAAVAKYQADWGSVVVLESATSRVLVLADSGLADPSKGPQLSRAVQAPYEPGSVGKVLTFSTALEQGTITPTSVFTVPDEYVTDDGEVFNDIYDHETYERTAAGILTQSSNTGTIQIGQTVSGQDRYQTMKDFGLGALTGIELPGESAGILDAPEDLQGRDHFTTMFGQRYSMTAVQEAAMMATFANGGVWQAPRLVDAVTEPNGTYKKSEPAPLRQVVSPETAKTMIRMMESVSSDKQYGTGSAAAVEGYRIAIKTGTSEINQNGTVATVAGVLPADDPKLSIAVVLYNPKSGFLSSESAAPLFQKVAAASLQNLGIPASSSAPELYPITP